MRLGDVQAVVIRSVLQELARRDNARDAVPAGAAPGRATESAQQGDVGRTLGRERPQRRRKIYRS